MQGTVDMTIPASERAFLATAALIFLASAAVTVHWCAAMSAMGGMAMPGGWTMSMTWMRMGGQSWLDDAGMFLAMWAVMMVAMMLPALVPMLRRYRQAAGEAGVSGLGGLTAMVGLGYFTLWIAIGIAVFPLGALLGEALMRHEALSRAVPVIAGVAVLIAGVLQLTPWKARRLACCEEKPGRGSVLRAHAVAAWQHGLRLGARCGLCCANLMAVLLVLGVMDLAVMALVTAAITLERVMPKASRLAEVSGVLISGAGLFLIGHALR